MMLAMAAETGSEHEGDSGVESTNSGDCVVYIRISVPELNTQKCLQFNQDDTVWVAKQQILSTLAKDLKDGLNYGLFCPPMNGRASKFLDEERLLKDYALPGPIGYLEFKYKRRIYKDAQINARKLKQLHNKANMKQFIEAVRKADIERAKKLMDKGLDPNFQDFDTGDTPMTCAVSLTRPRALLLALVDGGALLDYRARNSLTPMHVAARLGNAVALKTLLDLGAGVNYRDERGLTPLYQCVCHSTDGSCVNLLLYNYAVVGTTDSAGWTELHQACKNGRVQHVEQLLFYGADINQQNSGGNTPLHVCAINNQEECARMLLFRGTDRSIKNYANQTAAEVAIIASNSLIADVINNYSETDVVPIQELPSYNEKRRPRASILVPLISNLQRCRSNPQLHYGRELSVTSNGGGSVTGNLPTLSCASFQNGTVGSDRGRSLASLYKRASSVSGSNGTGNRGTGGVTLDDARFDSDSMRSMSVSSASSVPGSAGEVDISIARRISQASIDVNNIPRVVVLQKGSHGFGFVLRGAKADATDNSSLLDFMPTAEFPGLQYIEYVEPDSAAARAGLLAGDFILEINGQTVVRASHDYAVQLIRDTSDILALKVLTIASTGTSEVSLSDVNRSSGAASAADTEDAFHGVKYESSPLKSSPVYGLRSESMSGAMTWRGWPTRPSHDLDKLSPAAATNLLRFGSVPSIPMTTSYHSPNTRSRLTLKTTADDGVYATPFMAHLPEEENGNLPPPLPPPPGFHSPSSDVVPITTKLPHTYANVSQILGMGPATSEVESSFRPGTSAQLDCNSTGTARRRELRTGGVESVGNGTWKHERCRSENQLSVLSESHALPTSSGRSTPSSAIYQSPPKMKLSNPIPSPPPLPPSLWPGAPVAPASSQLLPPTHPPPPPPPPPPPLSPMHVSVPVHRIPPPPVARKPVMENSTGPDHASAIRDAVLKRQEFIVNADMSRVAESIEQRVQRSRPLRRVFYRADRSKEVDVALAAKIAEEQEGPSVLRSVSEDRSRPVSNVAASSSTNGPSNDFLIMAESARQEYLKRRASVVSTDSQKQQLTASSTAPTAAAQDLGSVAQTIAQKATERRRRTLAGEEFNGLGTNGISKVVVAGATDDYSYTEMCLRRKSTSVSMVESDIGNGVMDRARFTPFHGYSTDHTNGSSSSTSSPLNGYSTSDTGTLSVWNAARLSEQKFHDGYGSTGESNRASEMSEADSLSYEHLIVPPPPDFAEPPSRTDYSRSQSTLAASTSIDLCSEFSGLTPPPPLEFTDDDDDRETGMDFRLRPITTWSVGDVVQWLDMIQMGAYRDSFVGGAIDGRRLVVLGRSELISLGVTQVGHRMNIERAIKRAVMSMP